MIQLQREALIICHQDGQMEPLNIRDLLIHLLADPDLPGELDPWIMEKIVETIIHHFRNELHRETVSLSEFVDTTRELLRSFFEEASLRNRVPGHIDLFETVRSCGNGFELEFYNQIRVSIQQHAVFMREHQNEEESMDHKKVFRITGLRSCAKYLSGKRRWSKNCTLVRDEILSFIRAEAARVDANHLSLAIVS